MTGLTARRAFTAVAALIGWGGVLLQFYLSLRLSVAGGRGIGWGIVMYFGYFTILTNILVALALSAPFLADSSRVVRFFARPGVNTAIAAAIAIVGIVYSLVLRQIWDPQGLQLLADRVLHDVMPIVFLAYWWLAVPKERLRWRDIAHWLSYPAGYLFYVLARGAIIGSYPYPFINVEELGYVRVLVNSAGLLAAFVVVAVILVWVGRFRKESVS